MNFTNEYGLADGDVLLVPEHQLEEGEWKPWLLDEVNSIAFHNCELVNHPAIQNLLSRFYTEQHNDHSTAQDLWYQLQPYFIEKANRLYAAGEA